MYFKKSVSIIINEGSTYGLDFIFGTGNDVKEATLTWVTQSLFQNSRQNPLDTTPTRPMTRTIQSRQNSKNEVETTSKIQLAVSDSVSKLAPKSVIYKPIANTQEFKIIRKNSNHQKFQQLGSFQIYSKPEKSFGGPDKDRVIFPFQGTCSEKKHLEIRLQCQKTK